MLKSKSFPEGIRRQSCFYSRRETTS